MKSLAQPFEDLLITPVSDGPFFVKELFRRKFDHDAPDYGLPVVCFYRHENRHFMPLCYTSFLPFDEVILVGGAMTDGRVYKAMDEGLANDIRASGGIYYHVLRFAFDHFADRCEAFFGHAGDPRAYEVDINAGFEPTPHEFLIAHFHRPLTEQRRRFLIEKVHAIGPF